MTNSNKKIYETLESANVRDAQVWKILTKKFSQLKTFFIGLVITIGSVGLILGALTCAVASIAIVYFSVELVPAMLIGFFSVGVISLVAGLAILKTGIPK